MQDTLCVHFVEWEAEGTAQNVPKSEEVTVLAGRCELYGDLAQRLVMTDRHGRRRTAA